MSDLKIIDELLCVFKQPGETWKDVEQKYYITKQAMDRLRRAWLAEEMPWMTASLALYFEETTDEKSPGARAGEHL